MGLDIHYTLLIITRYRGDALSFRAYCQIYLKMSKTRQFVMPKYISNLLFSLNHKILLSLIWKHTVCR